MLWIGIGIGLCIGGAGASGPAPTGNLQIDGFDVLVDTFPIVFS